MSENSPTQGAIDAGGGGSGRFGIRRLILPANQRRTLSELTSELDLRSGDVRAKLTAFWTMLFLSGVIAAAGILADSTATVIGAMIIAPLSTPIMGVALAIAKRRRNGALLFVLGGMVLAIATGAVFSLILPAGYDLLDNSQIAGRVGPGLIEMIAALATGLAGAVALARRDVAAVLPGVAIAISLVPPLAVVGVCLGRLEFALAFGATLLFVSNFLALVLAGTLVFTVLGYGEDAHPEEERSRAKAYTVLVVSVVLVAIPLALNTFVSYMLSTYRTTIEEASTDWLRQTPAADVTDVESHGLVMTVRVRTPEALPPTEQLADDLRDRIPDVVGIQVESTVGQTVEVRPSVVS